MAEFAEESFEKLVPAFESIKASKLFTPDQFSAFVQQCSRFEYRLQKRNKTPMDFELYISHLRQFIAKWNELMLKDKRKVKKDDVARKLFKKKVAWLYRIRSQRFKNVEYFLEEARFCRSTNLLSSASDAYNNLLQIHGSNPAHYFEAANFELRKNKNVDNAQTILLFGLRKFPDNEHLLKLLSRATNKVSDQVLSKREETTEGVAKELMEETVDKASSDNDEESNNIEESDSDE